MTLSVSRLYIFFSFYFFLISFGALTQQHRLTQTTTIHLPFSSNQKNLPISFQNMVDISNCNLFDSQRHNRKKNVKKIVE